MKPTFVLVVGSWHTTACYDPLVKALADAGYPSVAPDADALKDVLVELQGKDVILVMHSYGGIVGTDVVGDLVANQPDVAARIKRLVYLAAFIPLKGENLVDMFLAAPGSRDDPYFDYDDGYLVLKDYVAELFYHDVPEPERSRYTAMLGKHAAGANTSPVSHVGYEHVPSTYIFTTLDRALEPQYQKFAVERARSRVRERIATGEALTEPFSGAVGESSMETGHSVMIVRPVELAGILSRIAEGN